MRISDGNQIDLVLTPEELGRVTISFQGEGDSLRVHLNAERPETLDLLRRHLPDLAAELRAMGYESPGFSFGGMRHPRSGQPQPGTAQDADGPGATQPSTAPAAPRSTLAGMSGSLDLRL